MRSLLRRSLLAGLPVALSVTFGFAVCASAQEGMQGVKVTELHPVTTPTPFPLDVSTGSAQSLEFRTPEQMTAGDRALAQASQAEIARRAALQGFGPYNELAMLGTGLYESQALWGYEQAVCPVFPEHLVLEYSRNAGPGDVTLFSVVIPRGTSSGEDHVRVIPVRRRSYSLFTPAASNALTLNDFNYLVKAEPGHLSPDWLTVGLCFAALAGGHVRAALLASSPSEEHYPLFAPASLSVSRKGGAEVRFVDATPQEKAMVWDLSFAQDGRLLKVRHTPASGLQEKPLTGNAAEVKDVPVKGNAAQIPKPEK